MSPNSATRQIGKCLLKKITKKKYFPWGIGEIRKGYMLFTCDFVKTSWGKR